MPSWSFSALSFMCSLFSSSSNALKSALLISLMASLRIFSNLAIAAPPIHISTDLYRTMIDLSNGVRKLQCLRFRLISSEELINYKY